MMRQYEEAKLACPEALLLFRMGDFYELFHEDAQTAARVLGLTLTSRDKGENPIPMAGFPHHQLESYLAKLINAGFRAAICEQVENPKEAKGLVKREVTRIVTPGTVTDDALLDPRQSNYLAAVAVTKEEQLGLAWVELSTGAFWASCVTRPRAIDELARLSPAECLLAESVKLLDAQLPLELLPQGMLITRRADWTFAPKECGRKLAEHFGTKDMGGFGFESVEQPALCAAGAVLEYLSETQKSQLAHIDRLMPYRPGDSLEIDEASRRSLELTSTIRDGRRENSLLGVLDKTVTAMGSRRLADWLAAPLTNLDAIVDRHDAVGELVRDAPLCAKLRDQLNQVYDLQRLLARVTTGRASPRDLSFIGRTLQRLPAMKAALAARQSHLLNELEQRIDLCPQVANRLEAALEAECPLNVNEGGFIRAGFLPELDALRDLAHGGKQWIANYQKQEIERTGISTLKVGFNKVFGYYLEVTNAHREKIPADYIRKQTIKNAERYITPELKEYEEKVLSADEKAKELEQRVFLELRAEVQAATSSLQGTADALAQIDVLSALAEQARLRGYCRPAMTDEPVLIVEDGRHPVLDVTEPEGTFVPNDVRLGESDGMLLLITGPNMAGKSTFIRQVALLTVMAQMGSFVPARSATIGVADRIFARVGASDELSRGRSTFMVEMTETARILNTATERSLVILDEIGRGTSTYDGVSLAWSVTEHLHDSVGCRTLFATHYHELTDLARSLPRLKNYNVAVREWDEEIVFLHKIVTGAADKSYGIHVARLAGVPREVIQRAKDVLWQLEEQHVDASGRVKVQSSRRRQGTAIQLTLFEPVEHPLIDELRKLDINSLTPLAALNLIENWKQQVDGKP